MNQGNYLGLSLIGDCNSTLPYCMLEGTEQESILRSMPLTFILPNLGLLLLRLARVET